MEYHLYPTDNIINLISVLQLDMNGNMMLSKRYICCAQIPVLMCYKSECGNGL